MLYYIEISLFPDQELRSTTLMNVLYTKRHKALYDLKSMTIGISFPKYKKLLGNTIRMYGTELELSHFVDAQWLGGLSGYCAVSEIQPVPENIKHRNISRWQSNMSEVHLRRLIKRAEQRGERFSGVQVKDYRSKMFKEQMTQLPFVELQRRVLRR